MASRIVTARDLYGVRDAAEARAWLLAHGSVRQTAKALGVREQDVGAEVDIRATGAVAYVNHGRWVADCPTEGCGGAEMVTPDAPFLCGTCLNAEIGCKARQVAWPAQRSEIEGELVKRPVVSSRNWHPGETVERLRAENVERGIEVV